MKNKTKGLLFQIPAMILLVGAFIVALVLRIVHDPRINSWAPAIILGIISILFFYGVYLSQKEDKYY